jgi:hypothetical protein
MWLASAVAPGCVASTRGSAPNSAAVPPPECDCFVFIQDELTPFEQCLRRTGSAYTIAPTVLAELNRREPSPVFDVWSSCGLFHARRDGLALRTHLFDNGPDPFCSGLSRHVHDGKYGYMNRALDVVVAPQYDFAFPFEGGRGIVCNDCTQERLDEYTAIRCVHCGAVDQAGDLVVPLDFSSQEMFVRYPSGECEP